jgi:chromosome partitioning protein
MAKIIVVTNRKGGTGKTSTSVNLAAELAAKGERVLLIDLDTQSHCALGLGTKHDRTLPTAHGFFAGKHSLSEAIQHSQWENLDIIAADPLFEHGSGRNDDFMLRQALADEGIVDQYDRLILDTPPSLDTLLLNGLYAADRVLVPFLPHFLAGEGVRQLARVLFRVGSSRANDGVRFLIGFVPIMIDNRISQHKKVAGGVANQFGATRMLPGIRNDIRVAESFAAGKPVRYYAPKCRATNDFKHLTAAVLQLLDPAQA